MLILVQINTGNDQSTSQYFTSWQNGYFTKKPIFVKNLQDQSDIKIRNYNEKCILNQLSYLKYVHIF